MGKIIPMREKILIALLIVPILFCSWTMDAYNDVNISSWNISIGKNVLLSSRGNNEMGDTAIFDKTKFRPTDTLFAERYLCGSLGQPAVTTLTIKNYKNEIIKEVINKDYQNWGTAGYIQLSQIINLNDFKTGQTVGIFLAIDFLDGDSIQPVLLGNLKIK